MAKILIVEDNEMNLDMLTRRLTRRGYNIVSATDGIEGLQLASHEQPDLVLMDMSLPKMDGWEATKHLKANAETSSIPVIALTAHAMVGDRAKALEAGCDDYDTKPIDLSRLLLKIGNLLGESSELAAPDADLN
jgi:two-component system, cell cycle response regulator DivK